MAAYRETLSIAGIRMAVESESEFRLADRCCYFKADFDQPDVVFQLVPADSFDVRGMECLQKDEKRAIFHREHELFLVRYDRETGGVRWYTCEREEHPGFYEVHVLSPAVLDGVNPLIFVELSDFMVRHNSIILHSSLISCDGLGVVFSAPSQTGKSTQASLWKQYRGAEILNGDRSILKREGCYRCYGSPYSGSSGIYENKCVDLTAVVVLRQAKENRLRRLTPKEAYLCLLSEMSLSPISRETVDRQSRWLLDLIGTVPVYLLECLPDEGAVDLLYRELKENC